MCLCLMPRGKNAVKTGQVVAREQRVESVEWRVKREQGVFNHWRLLITNCVTVRVIYELIAQLWRRQI